MRVVATLRELVLPIGDSIGKDQRIGPFLADGPRKVRESDLANSRIQHRVANLAEPAFRLPGGRTRTVGWDPAGYVRERTVTKSRVHPTRY